MDLAAQKAGTESEDQTNEGDECLAIVPVEGTILFDGLDGGRTDWLCQGRVVLSPPPFEGMKRNSLRRSSVRFSGEFSRNHEKNSGKKQRAAAW